MNAVELHATGEKSIDTLSVDYAELLLAIERAEEATRQKSAFLANMSHELRTPLASMIGFAELLQNSLFGSLTEQQARFVENILISARHLLTLINDLLDLSKIEAGKLKIQAEPFLLHEALEAAVYTVRPQADRKCQHVELFVKDERSVINADLTRFKQILYNLLSNAIKFTPDGGRITVSSRIVPLLPADNRYRQPERVGATKVVEIAVADTGVGISAADLTRLFERFTQLDAPAVKRYQGAGLGLALTKCLVELHGGSIQAHSEGEGRGSTFTVRLPYAEA